MRTDAGRDVQFRQVMDPFVDTGTSSTAPTATTFTCDGKSYATNALAGHVVVRGGTYAVVISNTVTGLIIDKWYDPTNPGGAAAATPAAGVYVILPGNAPAIWIALSSSVSTVVAGDTTLPSEITSGTLSRAIGAYAHTDGTNTATLSKTFTSDQSITVSKGGACRTSRLGNPLVQSLISSPPPVVSGDQVQITLTLTL